MLLHINLRAADGKIKTMKALSDTNELNKAEKYHNKCYPATQLTSILKIMLLYFHQSQQ